MSNKKDFGGLIWTDHALERLNDRKLPQSIAILAFKSPNEKIVDKKNNTLELKKTYKKDNCIYTITLIVSRNEEKKWVVISTWIDPPFKGSIDIKKKNEWKKKMKENKLAKRNVFMQIWLTFKRMFKK